MSPADDGAAEGRREYATIIRGGLLVVPGEDGTLTAESGDLLMEGERIARLGGAERPPRGARILYASGCAVLPGFVQSHVHLCHGLFRGLLDGALDAREMQGRVLALEASHTAQSVRAGARLTVAELLLGGTTGVQAMESVHHTDAVLEVLLEAGLFAVAGKSLVDRGDDPAPLVQSTQQALREAVDLAEQWDGSGEGRLHVCLAPRDVDRCSDACLREVGRLAEAGGWRVQVEAGPRAGAEASEVEILERHGLLGPWLGLAHWAPSADGRRRLAGTGVQLLHCPASDARRGLQPPPLAALRREGLTPSLGSDGAGTGSSLDMFRCLRLAVLMQSAIGGPGAVSPAAVLDMATRGGAAAMGRAGELGELREGAPANVVLVSLESNHTTPCPDPVSALVNDARSADIRAVWLAGNQVVSEGRLTLWDEEDLRRDARREARALASRAGLGG